MKKFIFCLLALLLALQLSAFAEETEIVQKDLLPEATTQALSVNDFVTDTEYPYETVGYFLNDVAFLGEDAMEVSITFTGNYGSNEYFFSKCYIPVYNYETGKLLDIFYSDVELVRPFANSSRTTIKRVISTKNIDTDIYKIKVIMLESLTSLRPNCPVPYLANELVISKNDIGKDIPTVTFKGKMRDVPLSDEELYVIVENIYSIKLSDAAFAMGYSNYDFDDNMSFKNNLDLKPYLGLYCDFVVDLSDELNWEIISVTPTEGKNIEVVIDPELLVSTNNSGYVEYYKSYDDKKTSKLKLDYALIAYCNLVYDSYDYIVVPGGNVGDIAYRFVDTDYNGMYDTVFVKNEQVFVAGYVNTATNKIYRDTYTNISPTFLATSLALDPEDEYISWSIHDIEGNTMELGDIKAGDVIAVATSWSNGYEYYDITVSNEEIEGYVTEFYYEVTPNGLTLNKISIEKDSQKNGYMMADNSVPVDFGDYIRAKIYDGKIWSYEVTNLCYGVILDSAVEEGFSNTYQVKLLNRNGESEVFTLADRVNHKSPNYSSNDEIRADFPVGDIIAYQLNSDGKIYAYDVQTGYDSLDANALQINNKFVETSSTYRESSNKLGSYYLTEDTLVYISEVSREEITQDDIILMNDYSFVDDANYQYSVLYDDDTRDALVVFLYEVNLDDSTEEGDDEKEDGEEDEVFTYEYPLVVTKTETVTVDGEPRTKIWGYINSEVVEFLVASNADAVVSTLSKGDVANITCTNNGTNTLDQIVTAQLIAEKNENGYIVIDNAMAGAADDTYQKIDGNYVTLNTFNCYNPEVMMSIGQIASLEGFGAAGKGYRVQGNLLRLINANDYPQTFGSYERIYSASYDEDRIQDYYVDTYSLSTYCYNAKLDTIRVTSIYDLETDNNTMDYRYADQLDNDDLIYVYNYDGETKLILIVDVMGDNL